MLINTKKRVLLALLAVGIITATVIILIRSNSAESSTQVSSVSANNTSGVQIQPAKAKVVVNKEFSFPIKDDRGKEVGNIKYLIENAEKRDEILIKGQKATAIAGRTFLILNLKIENKSTHKIQVNTRDYVRLSVNNGKEWLAPDIHNDPVEAQAIATKYTRIGFPISDTDNKLTLQAGEINGNKTTVDLKF
ncbi:hypothetical protein HY383_04835 [Candidatus Daviesbacteria bacterium]|nr:hypothetical protein [Candidatus Daviesbacteria bacterium]